MFNGEKVNRAYILTNYSEKSRIEANILVKEIYFPNKSAFSLFEKRASQNRFNILNLMFYLRVPEFIMLV